MAASNILIEGAREHNLRDVNLVIPRNRLICFTGVSGSGKSSLAFDTLYAEGQRRYVESLSSFARQFLGQMPKPDVDRISGLSPSISISQKTAGQSPRSTVGTITEIHDYLRVLFARVGKGHCSNCHRPITAQTREQILDRLGTLPAGMKFMVLAPLIRGQKGEYRDLFADLLKQGFARARVDGRVVRLSDDLRLDRQMRHNIEVVIDRLAAGPKIRPRLAEAVELALKIGDGNLIVAEEEGGRGKAEGGGEESALSRGPENAKKHNSTQYSVFGTQYDEEEEDESSSENPPSAFSLPPSEKRARRRLAAKRRPFPFGPLRLHALQFEFRAAQPADVFVQQSPGDVSRMQRLGQNLQFRSGAAHPRSDQILPTRLHRTGRQVEGDGPLAAAHIPRRGRNIGTQARVALRHDPRNRLGGDRSGIPTRPALGHRRRAHHLYVAERPLGLQMGAANSRASSPNCFRNIARRKAARNADNSKNTCAFSSARNAMAAG